jgi:cell division protein FtsL
LASWPVAQGVTVDAPVRRPGTRVKRRARARGGILWIAFSGVLLAGVVFVNVAVLRANLSLDSTTNQRAKLRAENQALQSQLASALASPKIQSRAQHQLGLVAADPSSIRYLNVSK